MRSSLGSHRGLTLIEATIILSVVLILTGVSAPAASRVLDQARLTRAVADMDAIKTAVDTMQTEIRQAGFNGYVQDPLGTKATTETLVGDGDIPPCVSVYGCTGSSETWVAVAPATCTAPNCTTDFLERHLVTNTPAGGGAYPTGGGNPWRGPYINAPINPDPWGNRYAVNVKWMKDNATCNNGNARSNDVFVLSAGPDETIQTRYRFDLDATGTTPTCTINTAGTGGAYPEGDDIISIVRRDVQVALP